MIIDFFKKNRRKDAHMKKTIGLMGADAGVGTSFIALSIANYVKERDVNVAIINYSNKEKYERIDVKMILDELSIQVYSKENIREAFNDEEVELVIYDFGKLNRENNELLTEFERCYKKFIVTVPTIFKRNSINNILHYNATYSEFSTVFNMTDEETFFFIKKNFKDLHPVNFPCISDFIDVEGMEEFAKELFYEF